MGKIKKYVAFKKMGGNMGSFLIQKSNYGIL